MSAHDAELRLPARGPAWKWWVCGLLLLATMLNYMDRLTLNLMSVRILGEFHLDERDYGRLESAFAYAFALGAIVVGWMADRWNVRWIYAAAVVAWSAAGFLTGLAQGFLGLLLCRFLLGLAEAGNWPCALRTTQHIIPPAQRSLGNGILQSGAALGAILTPLIVLVLIGWTDTWRYPFLAVGALGLTWVVLWLFSVRHQDLALDRPTPGPSLVAILGWLIALLAADELAQALRAEWLPCERAGFVLTVKLAVTGLGIAGVYGWLRRATGHDAELARRDFFRRFWVLVVLVVAINTTWHFFRAWLPLFLQKQHDYTEDQAGLFMSAYYVATDLGSLSVGFTAFWLTRRGWSVHLSRVLVFLTCAALTTLSVLAAFLPAGPLLLGVLLVIGFGALGLFPNYYSFSQELTVRHQGKLTGALGCINWLAMALLHAGVGDSIKRTGSYSLGVALAGLAPLVGCGVLAVFWGSAARPHPAVLEEKPLSKAEPARPAVAES
jgi:ACS family hexuronate transporter-like MFS transporter